MKRQIAAAAAALAAGIGMTVAAGLAAPVTAMASTPASWNRIFQSREAGTFTSVAAISKSDVWTAGYHTNASGQPTDQPYILRFNGTVWKSVTIPGAKITQSIVQATSASDVWVFGLIPNKADLAESAAYRWDGAHWHKVPVPARTYLQGTVVLGPSNVWAFGGSGTMAGDVFHWNGSKWTAYNLNFIPQSISASSAANVWLAGLTWSGKTEKAAVYRWNGSRWLAVTSPHPVVEDGPGVTALSPSNVWFGWDTETNAYAEHWNGHQWQLLTTPTDVIADTSHLVPDGRGGYWFGPYADWTGHSWINAFDFSTAFYGGGFTAFTRIPGTSSFVGVGGFDQKGSNTQYPQIYRFELG
jgi:hypothetical protein